MNVSTQSNSLLAQAASGTAPALTVCMHVLGVGRTDVRVMRAATTLLDAGYAVSVVDVEDEAVGQKEEAFQGISLKHVTVSHAFTATRFKRWAILRAAQLFLRCTLRLLQTPADVYHAHDVSALPACFIASRFRRKPLIFEAHEMPLQEHPVSGMSAGRRWLHSLLTVLLAYIIPRCAGVITVSPPIVEEIRSRYHVAEVTLLRNLPPYCVIPPENRIGQLLGLKPEMRIALYQGYLQANRGLDQLVRAGAFLDKNIVIVMMGKGLGTTHSQLEALIASEGLADRVKLIPAAPYAELLHWTASADIGLSVSPPDYSPNVRAFLPNKLFEYLMAGLPVITSPLESIVEVVNKYDVGCVVSSLTPEDIARAINALLADPAALARMHQNALEAARVEYCWEKESPRLLHLYQTLRG